MTSSDDYLRQFDTMVQTTKDKAEWAAHLQSKEFVDDVDRRRKAVGWKWSDFYKAITTDSAAAMAELERREQQRKQR